MMIGAYLAVWVVCVASCVCLASLIGFEGKARIKTLTWSPLYLQYLTRHLVYSSCLVMDSLRLSVTIGGKTRNIPSKKSHFSLFLFIKFPNDKVWIKMPLPNWKASNPQGDIKLAVNFG